MARLLFLVALLATACAPPSLDMRATAYEIEARLDPVAHTLQADIVLDLQSPSATVAPERGVLELRLHPELTLDSLEVEGATLRSRKRRKGIPDEDDEQDVVPVIHRLQLDGAEGGIVDLRLKLKYHGTLFQDVAAGEKEGEVHNFAMSAHVGEDGVYLEPGGYWYPRIELAEDDDPERGLATFRLAVEPVEGFELVAGLEREPRGEDAGDDGMLRWASPFPLDGTVLLGGPLQRWSRRHGEIELHAVLAPGKDAVAADILDASAEYLDRYQPLVGPYPFSEFTVLEAFFSSGFAFPTCTQIAGSQLSEYKQYRRHGYLDHELLHNWWGNGVFVDPRDGNWCEGLAAYLGNYYGFVLEGDDAGARKVRRNHSNFLSAVEPDEDKPLGTFGLDDGAGRGIGYQKGAAVFHMLERKIGVDAVAAGLRRLTEEQMGRYASWDEIQRAFESESGAELDTFFEQWVRSGGAPQLGLVAAEWSPGNDRVAVTMTQEGTDFAIDVPLRLHYGERAEDVVVALRGAEQTVQVPCEPAGLTAVELDPDYHVFRRLKPEETMPTTALTRRAERLVIVVPHVPEGELLEGYQAVVDIFSREVLGDEDEPEEGHEVLVRDTSEITAGDLTGASLLIVGDAVRQADVHALLARTRSPVTWQGSGFSVEGTNYDGAGHAVLATVHHPDDASDGITVYYGNSGNALANARVLTYYANSLLVYETPDGDGGGAAPSGGMPRTEVVRRIDFEFHDRVEL